MSTASSDVPQDGVCPACEGRELTEIYRLASIPVQSGVLLDSRAEALSYPRAPLVLMSCAQCGFIFNAAFQPELVNYAEASEESQHFSGTFNRFAEQLIAEIAATYDLKSRSTLEIGCGKGDFLTALVRATGTQGLGIDPGFLPERFGRAGDAPSGSERAPSLAKTTFRREYFDPDAIDVVPDFVVCRHTLEHIGPVGHFVGDIARLIGDRPDVALFFETPDVRRILSEGAFWDIYYEHCSYFTLGSHARLFRRHGFGVTGLRLVYDDQYIIQHACRGPAPMLPAEDDLDAVRMLAQAFPERVAAVSGHWRRFVQERTSAGKRIAIWGGGSKGVAFLTSNGFGEDIADVVDINRFKQGKYLPGTGHCIIGPEALTQSPPDTVIVMNPIYVTEIRTMLSELDLFPELVAV